MPPKVDPRDNAVINPQIVIEVNEDDLNVDEKGELARAIES